MNLAGVGRVQIGVQDPISDLTLLTTITAPAKRGDVKLQVHCSVWSASVESEARSIQRLYIS